MRNVSTISTGTVTPRGLASPSTQRQLIDNGATQRRTTTSRACAHAQSTCTRASDCARCAMRPRSSWARVVGGTWARDDITSRHDSRRRDIATTGKGQDNSNRCLALRLVLHQEASLMFWRAERAANFSRRSRASEHTDAFARRQFTLALLQLAFLKAQAGARRV